MPFHPRPHIVHRLVAGLVMLGGAIDILDGLWTRHHFITSPWAEWLPLEVHHGSRALLVLSGILLIALGRGLGRGKRRAWQLATAIVCASLALHSARDIHLVFIIPLLGLLTYLLLARWSFMAGSDPISTRRSLALAPIFLLAILVYGSVGQFHLRQEISPPFEVRQALRATLLSAVLVDDPKVTALSQHVDNFFDSIAWLAMGSSLVLVWLMLRPVMIRRLDPSLPSAREIIRRHGHHTLASYAAEPGNYHFLTRNSEAAVAYRISMGTAITVGDPIGPPGSHDGAVDEFLVYCRKHDWLPCFYEVQEADLDHYRRRGLRTLKIAEEAVIHLAAFNLNTPPLKKVRNSITKVERENPGICVESLGNEIPEEIEDQLQMISEEWLSRKGTAEMGFTMGRFDPVTLAAQRLFVARVERRVLGFVTWRKLAGGRLSLDLMRYAPGAPNGLMDYLIGRCLQHFQQEGCEFASLSNAPLANVSPEDEFTILDRGVKLLFNNVRGIYEYKSLFQFKKKFNPAWEGRYLAFPTIESLPRIAVAILRVHGQQSLQRTLLGAA